MSTLNQKIQINSPQPEWQLNYVKINLPDFAKMEDEYEYTPDDTEIGYNPFAIKGLQNYSPVHGIFFKLTEMNYNSITFNHKYLIHSLKKVVDQKTKEEMPAKLFIKFSPLLDICHYCIGKYNLGEPSVKTIPTISNRNACFPKLVDTNNASYVDCFFYFLSSILVNNYGFKNGINFYGSFLGVQDLFKANVAGDIEYLVQSDFFKKNVGKEFFFGENGAKIVEYMKNFTGDDGYSSNSRCNRGKIIIKESTEDECADGEGYTLDYEDLALEVEDLAISARDENVVLATGSTEPFSKSEEAITIPIPKNKLGDDAGAGEVEVAGLCTLDAGAVEQVYINPETDIETDTTFIQENSGDVCADDNSCIVSDNDTDEQNGSSNSIYTTDTGEDNNGDEETIYTTDDDDDGDDIGEDDVGDDNDDENNLELEYEVLDDDDDEGDDAGEEVDADVCEETEEDLFIYIKNYPVNLICLEKCEGTLDKLFETGKMDEDLAISCMFQICMILITYQKVFHFTHNDLHTNNIMYVNTTEEYLYYKFENNIYRVPTFGYIFKIIDFGRSIYQFSGHVFCSDSFAPDGDAHTQYNSYPYYDNTKPRIDPNYSFDLCRLACSIYDFIIEDEEEELDAFQKIIVRWCKDDNGRNMLYRKNGDERYPNFKLYKMIARTVHKHTPQAQMKHSAFKQFLCESSDELLKNWDNVFNIDALSCLA